MEAKGQVWCSACAGAELTPSLEIVFLKASLAVSSQVSFGGPQAQKGSTLRDSLFLNKGFHLVVLYLALQIPLDYCLHGGEQWG